MLATIARHSTCVRLRETIVLNMPFPRTLLPVSSALTETAAFAASLALLALMMIVYGVAPTVAILWLPIVMLVTVAARRGDLVPRRAARPVVPGPSAVRDQLRARVVLRRAGHRSAVGGRAVVDDWLKLNPLTGLFEAYRDVLLYGDSPAAWELLYPIAWAGCCSRCSCRSTGRTAPHFAKVLG